MHPAPPSRAPLHLLLLAAAATVLSAPIDPYQREEIQNLIARSQFDDADRIMRAVLIDHPEDTDMICLRGTVAVLRDDPRQAETLFREALQRRFKEDRFLMNLAEHPLLPGQGAIRRLRPVRADQQESSGPPPRPVQAGALLPPLRRPRLRVHPGGIARPHPWRSGLSLRPRRARLP
ncbi:MAG: hypothetical protein U1F77_14460 [Kiritimatiellia bacterium]